MSRAGGEGPRHGKIKLAVLGDPLRYTRSPDLHRAGCGAVGIACESVALPTPIAALPATLERLAREGYAGCNLTMPLKEPALAWVGEATAAARRARSVNTIAFAGERGSSVGDTTDGPGFLDLLHAEGRRPSTCNVTLLGAGGSARSLALALADAGAPPARVVSRREPEPGEAWGGVLGARWAAWGSEAARSLVAGADVVVNCTPLGGDTPPIDVSSVPRSTLLVDLTYGERVTAWVAAAHASGHDALDGLALLVHQARRSLTRWLGCDVPLEPLLAAVRRET
jgi:shikimate dehydrogenase